MELANSHQEEIQPNSIIIKALKNINFNNLTKEKDIKVLDIGAGDGKDSLFLAKKGFDILAIDSSAHFIHKINQLAKIHNTKINTIIADAITYPLENYDIIICDNVLHFLKNNKIKELINKMKKHTKPSGLNVISAFQENKIRDINLADFYNNWKILYYNESVYSSINREKEKTVIEIIAKKI